MQTDQASCLLLAGRPKSLAWSTRSFFFFFLMWTIFKVSIEFVTVLLLFNVLDFWPGGMWDPSSLTRDRTCTPPALEGEVFIYLFIYLVALAL